MNRMTIDYEAEAERLPSGRLDGYLAELNLSRGRMAAAVLILIQLINLLDPEFYTNRWLWIASAAIVGASLLLLCIYAWQQTKGEGCGRELQRIYLGYWVLIALAMIPYFIRDAAQEDMPVNCILLAAVLTIIPAFPVRETVALFTGYTALNLIISLQGQTPLLYCLHILMICGFGCIFSCRTHQFYMGLLGAMQKRCRQDYMTKLLNRWGGKERIQTLMETCLRHQKTFAFFMVDVDGFKQYNDRFGHQAGDEALTVAATCLRQCFGRKTDVLCRYGGEEFLIAASVNSGDEAAWLANRAREAVENCRIEGACPEVSPFLTVSMGAAVFIPKAKHRYFVTVEEMTREADLALYQAKRDGRNRVCLVLVGEGAKEEEPSQGPPKDE